MRVITQTVVAVCCAAVDVVAVRRKVCFVFKAEEEVKCVDLVPRCVASSLNQVHRLLKRSLDLLILAEEFIPA